MEGGIVKSSDIELQPESRPCSSTGTTVHVKTLVWEVAVDSDCPPETLFYIVTAQKISDRVDVSRLQDLVCKQHHELPSGRTLHPPQLQQSRISISMAPTKTAEYLTGFQSGCMPPIGHTTPMKLYAEESIIDFDIASVGSGSLGHSVLLPTEQLLKCAEDNEHGLQVGSFAVQSGIINDAPLTPSGSEMRKKKLLSRTGSPSSTCNITRQGNNSTMPHRGTEPKDRLKEYKSLKV